MTHRDPRRGATGVTQPMEPVRTRRLLLLDEWSDANGLPSASHALLAEVMDGARGEELQRRLDVDADGLREAERAFLGLTGQTVYAVAIELLRHATYERRRGD